jgi:ketosteroid isomerase-like protein
MPKATAMILGDIYDAWRAQDLDWLASYLPNDFAHIINVPASIGPTAGSCFGKTAVIDRWRAVMADFEFLMFDTNGLMTERNRAAAEIPFRYRHRASGKLFEMTKGTFWILEDGWPVRLTEYYDLAYIQSFSASLASKDVA